MPNNVYKNIPTQYDCSAGYCATNLTVFETEFKLNNKNDDRYECSLLCKF